MNRRWLITALLLATLGTACRRGEPAAGPWQRMNLWAQAPKVLHSPFANPRKPAFEARLGYLGAQEVRDLSQVPPETFANYPHQAAGQVEVLEQVAGSRLGWRLTLGQAPYLGFTPLPAQGLPAPCRFRVELSTGGPWMEVYSASPALLQPAPQAEQVDLSPWAGKAVELALVVEPPAGASFDPAALSRVGWASPAVWSRGPLRPSERAKRPPNLLLIGIDTLRADHVGAFRADGKSPWGGVSLTPAIDRLAAQSDVWPEAYTVFNVTNPSFVSILTGLYGKNHGVYDLRTPVSQETATLTKIAKGAGYDTLALISARHLGPHNSGLAQGFDQVVLSEEQFAAELPVDRAMDWIAARERPFFLWLHLFDPHTPHTPPDPYALGRRPATPPGLAPVRDWLAFRELGHPAYEQPVLAGNRALYAGEVAYVDRQLDRLLDFLGSRGLLDSTVIALVGDHGENLGEHGILHRHAGLWETTTHVPLLIRRPAEGGSRHSGLVETIDLFPTVLALLGLPAPETDGRNLYEPGTGRPAVFAEHASQYGLTVRTAAHRWMRSAGNPLVPDGVYFYDLKSDPGEEHNLAGSGQPEEKRLAELAERWAKARRATGSTPTDLSPEDLARLRALGYL
ncbi:MAG: sulfatase [Thermoanaerobaculia bacterium]